MSASGIKGTFELYTEKEAFYNCAFLAALAKGSSFIINNLVRDALELKADPRFLNL